uniref:ABC1 atypical kinase-like domain-containing protein n=1 Tax=Lactuca sativa TaxID=4236 RepID=A0A9R1XTF6_LACSA|nr:hypothetical protein LSAT_V11C100047910 [Lactuca sativa]
MDRALADKGSLNLHYHHLRNTHYTHAENGHAILVSSFLLVFEGLILLFRAIYLAIFFSPSMAMAQKWLHLVRRTLEIVGPTFIIWGQWVATRPNLFRTNLCTELSKLHIKAPKHTLGHKISKGFDDFEEIPIVSRSIAQIHRAFLKYKYQGKPIKRLLVTVKVRHSGVGESVRIYFEIINVVAKMLKFIPTLNWLRLDEMRFLLCPKLFV